MQKKLFVRKFSKKIFFWKDFLEFLLFYLILGLSPYIQLFFQLSSCTGWSTIRDFWIFQKTAFLPFFAPLRLSCGVFFDKISSPLLFLTLNRGWECCLTSKMTFQPPPKNWQSSVTKCSMCAFFLADTVHDNLNKSVLAYAGWFYVNFKMADVWNWIPEQSVGRLKEDLSMVTTFDPP